MQAMEKHSPKKHKKADRRLQAPPTPGQKVQESLK
jgi:hypothetical protein